MIQHLAFRRRARWADVRLGRRRQSSGFSARCGSRRLSVRRAVLAPQGLALHYAARTGRRRALRNANRLRIPRPGATATRAREAKGGWVGNVAATRLASRHGDVGDRFACSALGLPCAFVAPQRARFSSAKKALRRRRHAPQAVFTAELLERLSQSRTGSAIIRRASLDSQRSPSTWRRRRIASGKSTNTEHTATC